MRTFRPARLLAACAALACVAGCGDRAGVDVAAAGAASTWRWRAASMDISGITTPMAATAARPATLDVRVQFFDSERDETKAIGMLTVRVLLDAQEIVTHRADLSSSDVHSRCWDSITETYSVPLQLAAEPAAGRTLVVQARFEGADGARMTASREVRWPERTP